MLKLALLALVASVIAPACKNKPDAPGATASATPPPAAPATPPPAPVRTCEGGDAAACVEEARKIAPTGGYRVDLPTAEADRLEAATTKLALRACELGNAEGCDLAARYGPDLERTKWTARACELGHVASCGAVGLDLLSSTDKAADKQRGAALVEKACLANAVDWRGFTRHHGGFCYQLSDLYAAFVGDSNKVQRFAELACSQGYKYKCPCKVDADCAGPPLEGMYCEAEMCVILGEDGG